jgi:hypothetical protein
MAEWIGALFEAIGAVLESIGVLISSKGHKPRRKSTFLKESGK